MKDPREFPDFWTPLYTEERRANLLLGAILDHLKEILEVLKREMPNQL